MTRLRMALALAALTASAFLLAACPRANGYQAVRVFPQISYDDMTGAFPMPGAPNVVLVVTRSGVIYRADIGSGAPPTVFLDIHDRLNTDNPGDEEGLLGLAYAPDFVQSHKFYVYYTAGGPRHNRVSRFFGNVVADPRFENIILELPPKQFSNHNGGNLAFGPDGFLYIGVGDGGSAGDPFGNGQNTNVLFGKVLRIDVSADPYRIPADNPFAHGGGAPEVYAFGLRNPWRFALDPATGALWLADVGQNQREEVDQIVNGGNYGWNIMEGDLCYKPSSGCNRNGLIPPRVVYGHDRGCSITGGYVYRGSRLPEMAGWFVYGDFCSGRIWAVNTAGGGGAVQLADTSLSISSFMQGADGEIYIVAFGGGIYLLAPK